MTPFRAHKNKDIITFKVTDFTKLSNKSMMPVFEELEKQRFKGHRKAYLYVCERFGSAFLECNVEIYINGEKRSYHELKVN
jgi:hypothetical protein